MLERLNSVDWARLTHAYGKAADVPDLIRALSSKDEKKRDEALGELFGNIWHQGTLYEATAFAVPFLIELLADLSVEGKDGILQLLASIADGGHAGVLDRMGIGPGSEQERADREVRLARELGWVRAAFEAVEAGVSTYLDLLTDNDPKVRIFSAYTLGHCRGRAAQVVPKLVARVQSETDARNQSALILALGSLRAAADEKGEIDNLLAKRIEPKECPVVRLAAAMCLARAFPVEPSPEVLDALTVSTGSAWSDFEGLPWCEGDVAVSVGNALAEHPQTHLSFLVRLLDSEDKEVRKGARYAMERLCHERRSVTSLATAALGERVLAGDLADRRGAVEILSRLGSTVALVVRPLSVALDDADPQLRSHAAIALAGLRDLRTIPVLIGLLKEDRFFPKIVKALSRFGATAKDAVPALLEDHFFPKIIKALARFGPDARDAVPALLDVLSRKLPRDQLLAHNRPIEIAVALGQIGPEARPAIPALIALVKKQPHTQLAAILALGQIGGTEARAAIPILKQLLRSQDELVRIRGAQTLWQIDRRADKVLPVLIELVQPGRKSRYHAAEALGSMGEVARKAVPALRACLDDRSFHAMWVHLKAAQALWRIDRSANESLPVLVGLLRDFRNIGPLVATQAAESLGEMGAIAQEALPVLRTALAGDIRPFGGSVDEIVIQDEEFCSTVTEAIRRIEVGR
jgi:HEAT repeat protein